MGAGEVVAGDGEAPGAGPVGSRGQDSRIDERRKREGFDGGTGVGLRVVGDVAIPCGCEMAVGHLGH